MPIYAYKCGSCGHSKDVLQKIMDVALTQCPACGAAAFNKQLTAAGFHLKGSGWYATDFKSGSSNPADVTAAASTANESTSTTSAGTAATPTSPASCSGGGCACH